MAAEVVVVLTVKVLPVPSFERGALGGKKKGSMLSVRLTLREQFEPLPPDHYAQRLRPWCQRHCVKNMVWRQGRSPYVLTVTVDIDGTVWPGMEARFMGALYRLREDDPGIHQFLVLNMV